MFKHVVLTSFLAFALINLNLGDAFAGPEDRFIRLDHEGQPIPVDKQASTWPCVLDQSTGLIWEVKTSAAGLHHRDNVFPWRASTLMGGRSPGCGGLPCDAHAFVRAVNQTGLCGARDWRLPEREELRSLVDYTLPYPGPTIDRRFFPHTRPQFYWAANGNAAEPEEAWGIGFAFGFDYAYYTTDRVWVRLVRGPRMTVVNNSERFEVLGNGEVLDRHAKLIWAQCSAGTDWKENGCAGQAKALSFSRAQELARNGWRIPSLKELSYLVDLSQANPAIDSRYFPSTPAGDFWSATPFTNQPDMTWRVHFREGEAHGVKNKEASYLRLVRDAK